MKKSKALFYALFVMMLWGTLFPVVKLGYSAYQISTTGDILFFAGVRFTVCGGIITAYTFIKDRNSFREIKHFYAPVLLSGVFAVVLHYSFTYLGLQLTASSKTAILKQIGALFYVCFSFLFFKEDKLTGKKLIALIMGFLGILAINVDVNGVGFAIGDLLIICASFCTVFANVISKKVFLHVKPITSTGISQLFGGVVLLILGKMLGGSMQLSMDSSIFIMGYICLASITSYCLWNTVVKDGELSKLFIIKFAEPAFACVFGALILREDIFQLQYLIAFLLIAGGIVVVTGEKGN